MRFPAGLLSIFAGTIVLLAGCGEPSDIETEIRAVIERAELAAEDRDVGALRKMIADEYSDPRRHDKKAITDLLRLVFLAHPSVHLAVYVEQIDINSEDSANVVALVGMADTAQRLPDVDLYQFDVRLVRDGDWKVSSAEWRRGLGKPPE